MTTRLLYCHPASMQFVPRSPGPDTAELRVICQRISSLAVSGRW